VYQEMGTFVNRNPWAGGNSLHVGQIGPGDGLYRMIEVRIIAPGATRGGDGCGETSTYTSPWWVGKIVVTLLMVVGIVGFWGWCISHFG